MSDLLSTDSGKDSLSMLDEGRKMMHDGVEMMCRAIEKQLKASKGPISSSLPSRAPSGGPGGGGMRGMGGM